MIPAAGVFLLVSWFPGLCFLCLLLVGFLAVVLSVAVLYGFCSGLPLVRFVVVGFRA